MSDCNGEQLLSVFKELNVQLLNLNPNVVKGWFDTDDKNMQYLLKWMCTSLSSSNFSNPLEKAEFDEIENALEDDRLLGEVCDLQTRYPNIFDTDSCQLDIQILEDEIETLIEDEKQLDGIISMSRALQESLTEEWSDKLAMEIKSETKLSNTEEKCNSLANTLDEQNDKLYKQLIRYGNNLYHFEFSEIPYFINNIEIDNCLEKYENLLSIFRPISEDPMLSFSSNQTFYSTMNLNDSLESTLSNLRKNICESHQMCLLSSVELEKMKELAAFLKRNTVDSIMSLTDNMFMELNIETKEETKRRMLLMLENISTKIADQEISSTRLKYIQNELDIYQSKSDELLIIEELLFKLLSQYIVLSIFYVQEKEDIDTSETYFRRTISYINQDLQNWFSCTTRMTEIIKKYKSTEPKNKFQLVKSMLRVLGVNEDFNLQKGLEVLFEFKNELTKMEERVFSTCTNHRLVGRDIKENIQTLQTFLVSGPTNRIVAIPCELLSAIKKAEVILEKQNRSIAEALQLATSIKKRNRRKWDIYKRQLWIYFYTDPCKLKSVLQQIEEEVSKMKITS